MTNTWLKYLFTDPLYVLDEKGFEEDSDTVKPTPETTENKSEFLVIVLANDLNSEGQKELLNNILKASDIREEDALIKKITDKEELPPTSGFQWVLSFGIFPEQGLAPYQIIEYRGSQWIIADSLNILDTEKIKKRQLWEVLKEVMTARRSP